MKPNIRAIPWNDTAQRSSRHPSVFDRVSGLAAELARFETRARALPADTLALESWIAPRFAKRCCR
jgi:hypothetical protein